MLSSAPVPTSVSSPDVSDPKHSTIIDPFTSLFPQPSDTPTPSETSAQATTPSSAPAASPTPSSSPSASKFASVSSSSSATPATLSSASTPLAVTTPTAVNANSPSTQVIINSFTHTTLAMSTLSPSATASPGSGGVKTGAVIGGVAGTLAAIAVVGILLMWCMRRQRNRDMDDFDAQAFKRQSVVLLDDPVEPPRTFNPRPPTMIEHHNASPALAAQGGFGGQNFYGNYGEYAQQPSYGPPEMMQPVGSPPPQAYPAGPMGYPARQPSAMGRPVYDPTQQLARQPSNAQYLTRQPTSAAGYAPPAPPPASADPNARYIDLNRSSVSPYQAAQYADISRQLGTNDPNGHLPHESLDLPDDPLPSPFDDPAEGSFPGPPTHTAAPAQATAVPSVHAQGHATQPHQRPETVYEEVDAYGGI